MANDEADSSCTFAPWYILLFLTAAPIGSEYRDIRVQKVENGPFKIVLIPTYNVCPTSDRQIAHSLFTAKIFQ